MKNFLSYFCTSVTGLIIILSLVGLINLYKQNNIIYISSQAQYIDILNDAHNNIDKYVGKKVSVSGYVYSQPDFATNRFVIAQNAFLDFSDESYIVGFLCENHSKTDITPNQTITIIGKIVKGCYNNSEYPIVKVYSIM